MKEVKEVDHFDIESESLEKQIHEKYSEKIIQILKRISYEISVVGLTEKEACEVCDFDYARYMALKESEPLIRRMFDRRVLEYKRSLLKPLSAKAKSDDKLAQWLLMTRFPEDFNKKRSGGGDGEDMLGAAIRFIQKKTDSTSGLISETAGEAFIIKRPNSTMEEVAGHPILKQKNV